MKTAARLAALAVLAAVLGSGAVSAAIGDGRVLILVTGGPLAYQEAESAAREALVALGASGVSTVRLDGAAAEALARSALRARPRLVIAIGSRAAKLAAEERGSAPLVYAMVLDPAGLGLPSPGEPARDRMTGVTMHVSAREQFAVLTEIAPQLKRVGVLYDPGVSSMEVRSAGLAAARAGLVLTAQPVRSEGEVLAAARLLAPEVDAFWAMADPTVLTPANARALILYALRTRKPLLAMAEGYVRSGALAALVAEPRDVGRRAGELALAIVNGTPVEQLPPEAPPNLSLFLNRASAAHLGFSLPPATLARAHKVYPAP